MDSSLQNGSQTSHDSQEWRAIRDAKLLEWFDGDHSAVDFVVAFSSIAELWDDLIDKDKEPSRQEIDAVFWNALVTFPCNEFFNKHRSFLMPLIVQAINAYHDSVELEKGGKDDRAYALTLRLVALQMCPMIVMLKKGYPAARAVSLDMWKFFTQHDKPIKWIEGK